MKSPFSTYLNFLLICLFALSLSASACKSSKSTNPPLSDSSRKATKRNGDTSNPNRTARTQNTLENMIRRVPGVEVRGNGDNLTIRVRGSSSVKLTTDPLFVVDGVPLGRSFAAVNRAVNPQDIDFVKVLKGADASIYGARGANGVIVIYLKK